MENTLTGLGAMVFIVAMIFLEIYGLYLSAQEGIGAFAIALFIPPWAMLKGLIGIL